MTRRSARFAALVLLALLPTAVRAQTSVLSDSHAARYNPRVPLSAFARPASWFDPSRLKLASTMSFGTGLGGGADGLSVTSLSYHFRAPVTMSVNIGTAFGANAARSQNPFFLEGLNVTWQPSRNTLFRVEMRDVRSPLQYGYGGYGGYGPWGRQQGSVDAFGYPY